MIIKHPRLIIKQHGIIKNYRYVGDVSTALRSILYHICFPIYYLPFRYIFICFCFQIYYSKNPKVPCCTFLLLILFCVLSRSIYPIYQKLIYLFTVEGLTTPLTRRVASICSLCAGSVYIVLLGSPTGLIPRFHN